MVLHYVKIQVKVLLKRFLYMRLLGQVVGLATRRSRVRIHANERRKKANWSASCQLGSLIIRLFGYSFHHCQG